MEESEIIWYDEMKNEYLKINNETGVCQKVYKTGDYIKEFDASLTGQVDYKERIVKAGDREQYYPHQPKSLHYDPNNTYYTPQNEKFLGYCQFGYPRCQPYFNDKNTIKNFRKNKKLNHMINQVRKNYSPLEVHNKTLYKFKSNQNTTVSYLTGTRKDLFDSQKKHKIEVLKQRSNTAFKDCQKGVVKIINNQKLSEPNLTLFEKKKKSFDTQQSIKSNKLKDYNTTQNQFLKTLEFYTLDAGQQTLQKQVSQIKSNINLEEYEKYIDKQKEFETTKMKKQFDALQSIKTKTYEKRLQDKELESMFSKQQIKRKKDYKQILVREQQELDCFQIPQQNQIKRISTKNRFNTQIPTAMDQYKKDRMLNKMVDPDLYKIKEVKKKRIFIDPLTGKNIL